MIKNLILSALFLLFSFISYAQFKNNPKISVGIAWRPELFELSNYSTRTIPAKGYMSDIGRMDNPNLVVEFSQRLNHERWILQFSNYFSHNYLATVSDFGNRIHNDISAFKYDVFIDAKYEIRFRKFKNSFIYVGAGVGRMNVSKKFDYNYPTGERDINGNWIYQKRSTSLSFWAPRLFAGFTYRKLGGFVTAHYTPDIEFNPKPSLWIEYKATYSFSLGKNKSGTPSPENKFNFRPEIAVGVAQRSPAIELSQYSTAQYRKPYSTYNYNAVKQFAAFNIAVDIKHNIYKEKIAAQLSSYLRYNHLYYGKNAQGISGPAEKNYKRLKADIFLDLLYNFKKKNENSIGLVAGVGYGKMNIGTRFTDSLHVPNSFGDSNYLVTKSFEIATPRILLGATKNKFSAFLIAHFTPDTYRGNNPTVWLELKASYSFSPFKK